MQSLLAQTTVVFAIPWVGLAVCVADSVPRVLYADFRISSRMLDLGC